MYHDVSRDAQPTCLILRRPLIRGMDSKYRITAPPTDGSYRDVHTRGRNLMTFVDDSGQGSDAKI